MSELKTRKIKMSGITESDFFIDIWEFTGYWLKFSFSLKLS